MTTEKKTVLTRLNPKVWTDIEAYFIERFNNAVEGDTIIMSNNMLARKMKERFGNEYDIDALLNLLRNGFQTEYDKFFFKREDFIRQPRAFDFDYPKNESK